MKLRPNSDAPDTSGVIFNVMRFALNDGPGIRTTVFLKGCPLACTWCHNPESQNAVPEPMYAAERCIACRECISKCHRHALQWIDGKPVRESEKCELCGECCEACPSDARRMVGQRASIAELLKTIVRDRIVYEESGGGVTFSGGEPLTQSEFLSAMIEACHTEGIHTAVDTCGHAPPEMFQRVIRKVDLLLFDLKLMNKERHRQATGVDNKLILQNLRSAADSGKSVVVRIPIVPGVNDDQANIVETIHFLQSCKIRHVDLLAYHATGHEKYRRLDAKVPEKFLPPTEHQMQLLCEQFAQSGFAVRIGG